MINIRIMRNILAIVLLLGSFISLNAQENEKIAQTGFQFLSVVSDAKASALANAVTTLNMKSSSLFFNPAGMTEMDQFIDVTASSNELFADIKHNTFSLALKPANGIFGVIGFSFQTVDYGDNFFGTMVDPNPANEKGYIETGDLSPSAVSFGAGYAKALSDKFSIGAQVRWNKQDFGTIVEPIMIEDSLGQSEKSYSRSPLSYDFGTIYKTGFKSLVFGMSVRNFSGEVEYIREAFQLPLVFTLGIHMDIMDFIDEGSQLHKAVVLFNTSHYRSREEEYQFALDYSFMKMLSLRGGYITGRDEQGFTFGMGITYKDYLSFDYAYIPFGIWDKSTRLTVRFSL